VNPLTVSPVTLDYAAAGGSQNVSVTSNVGWTAVSFETWATVSPSSGSNNGTVSVTAAANTVTARTATVTLTGGGLTQTVTVTREAEQQVIVEPSQPDGNQGTIDISLSIPVDETFSVTFTVCLPVGFFLDPNATALVSGLMNDFQLVITPLASGGWQFEIKPKFSLYSADEAMYQNLVQIAYTIDDRRIGDRRQLRSEAQRRESEPEQRGGDSPRRNQSARSGRKIR
jgi:hypothetical protein